METAEFAARRRALFTRTDAELLGPVKDALTKYASGQHRWAEDLIEAASVLWLEIFLEEAPHADPYLFIQRFQRELAESLARTTTPDTPPDEAQINRVTLFIGTYVVNNATQFGAGARGVRFKKWVTMHDSNVRETHVLTDGQITTIGGTFDVGGFDLHFPGEPVGPPEIWINCRCVIQPAARIGDLNVTPTTFAIAEDVELDVEDEDLPLDELEDDEEEITEIPVHGVLAPEGVPTGDGRQFAIGSLSHRDLPLPIAYQTMSAEGHSNSVTVGRIDEIIREGNEVRFLGALMTSREFTHEVVEGMIDGTVRGISVDVDNIVMAAPESTGNDVEDALQELLAPEFVEFSEARIAGVTIVPIPAFQEAYIALGHEFLADLPDEAKEALAACGCEKGPDDEEDENEDIVLAYDVYDLETFRDYSTEERKRLAKEGKALPDGSFPIVDEEDLRNAIQAIGRASDPEKARAHIKKRARALGKSDLIPEDWALDGENAMVAATYDASNSQKSTFTSSSFAPGTKDGPGWITHPIPTARIRRYWTRGKGAAKIRWGVPGDFNRCRRQLVKYIQNPKWLAGTCANMHKEALGFWPSTHRKLTRGHALAASAAPIFNIVASSNYVFDANMFRRQELEDPRVGIVVDGDHIYGYMAQWGVCHIGISGMCTEAPPSPSGYWYYQTGIVDTTEGPVPVGQITMDTGHAPLKASAKVAAAHYDNTGAAVADVHVGEDEFGIWFSGVLRRGVTDDQRHALRASGRISGDWRTIAGNLELVAGLVVNVPGLPIPHVLAASADGVQIALVAAGIVAPQALSAVTASLGTPLDAETVAGIARTAVVEYIHETKKAERVGPLRDAVRQHTLRALREKVKE